MTEGSELFPVADEVPLGEVLNDVEEFLSRFLYFESAAASFALSRYADVSSYLTGVFLAVPVIENDVRKICK